MTIPKPAKTLDEVIQEYEACINLTCAVCPNYQVDVQNCDPTIKDDDALYYLKEYQTLRLAYIKAIADLEDNPPLSWEELKSLEGRPVWVEAEKEYRIEKFWAIVIRIDALKSGKEWISLQPKDCYDKESYGIDWRAYRKEKTE